MCRPPSGQLQTDSQTNAIRKTSIQIEYFSVSVALVPLPVHTSLLMTTFSIECVCTHSLRRRQWRKTIKNYFLPPDKASAGPASHELKKLAENSEENFHYVLRNKLYFLGNRQTPFAGSVRRKWHVLVRWLLNFYFGMLGHERAWLI